MKDREPNVPLPQRIDAAIGSTLTGYRQVGKTWMHTNGTGETSFSTALTIQPSKYDRTRSYIVLSFFAGQNPPQAPEEWNAMRHASIRFEHIPMILEALREEALPELPRDLTVNENNPDTTLSKAEKIAQTAKTVFEKLETPAAILELAERLDSVRNNRDQSAILGITLSGSQALRKR